MVKDFESFESSVESFVDSTEKTEGKNGLLLLIPLAIVAVMATFGLWPDDNNIVEAERPSIGAPAATKVATTDN